MLSYMGCVQLLQECVESSILQRDNKRKDNILVYRDNGYQYQSGWFSENLMSVAQELKDDEEGQNMLISALQDKTGKPFKVNKITLLFS